MTASELDAYLRQTLSHLGNIYLELANATGQVNFDKQHFRHNSKSAALVCYLKGIKSISTLNACMVLLEHGYTQEIGALCRMVDDFCNEIMFLVVPLDGTDFTPEQTRFMEDFFQEEFDEPDNPLASKQKRETVPTKKIHATFAKHTQNELNPSDAQEILRTIHQAFSGYVHGAYPHIMEMYGGNSPAFHLTGMLGTPRIQEWRNQLITYIYRLLMASVLIANKLGAVHTEQPLCSLLYEFENVTGSKSLTDAATMLAAQKKKPL